MKKTGIIFILAFILILVIVTPVEALQNSSNSDHVIKADNVSVVTETGSGKLADIGHFKNLGTETVERSGKNLAGMSDNVAEWMVKSDIGKKALKEWSDEEQKGLGKIFEKYGDGVVNTLVSRYGDEIVEITSKGAERGVIDLNKDNPENLARYIQGIRKLEPLVIDPLDNMGENQLLKMIKPKDPSISTKIIDENGKILENIDGAAVLSKGKLYFDEIELKWKGYSWDHISLPRDDQFSHAEESQKSLILPDADQSVKNIISEIIETGEYDSARDVYYKIYDVKGVSKRVNVVIGSITQKGQIITAFRGY